MSTIPDSIKSIVDRSHITGGKNWLKLRIVSVTLGPDRAGADSALSHSLPAGLPDIA